MCLPKELKGTTIQYIVAVIGNILCLNFGLLLGMTPAHVALYKTEETPLNRPISGSTATWIYGYIFIGAGFGSLFFGLLVLKLGTRSVLLVNGLFQITSWACIHFAYDVVHIHSASAFAGIAAGASFTILPIYLREISQDCNCGALTASTDLWRTLGIFLGIILGDYVRYDYVIIASASISVAFTMLFPFSQESPYYYLRTQNIPALEKSLRWFRGIRRMSERNNPEYIRELDDIKGDMHKPSIAEANMPKMYIFKASIYVLVLVFGAQLTGIYIIWCYYTEIFKACNIIVFTDNANILILTGINLIGATILVWTCKKINRKILLCITSFVCCLSLASLALYLKYGMNIKGDPLYKSWIPLSLLSLHMLSSNFGMYPMATLIPSEMFASKLRTALSSIAWSLTWIVVFGLIQYFHPIVAAIKLSGLFFILAGNCLFITIFSLFFVKETCCKPLEEVQQQMGYYANAMEPTHKPATKQ